MAEPLAEQMATDAAEAMKYTRRHFVVELDYSPESIDRLEAAAKDVPFAINGGASAGNVAHLARVWGAYLGEVLRRCSDAVWQADESELPGLLVNGSLHRPHLGVRERLLKPDEAPSLDTFFQQCRSSQ